MVQAGTKHTAKTCCCAHQADNRFARTVPRPQATHPAGLHSPAASPRGSPKAEIPSPVPSKCTLTGEPRGTRGEPVALMGATSSSVMAWGRMGPVTAGPQLATPSTAHTAQHGAACHFLPHECPSTSSRRFAVEAAVPSLRLPLRKTSCGAKMWLWYHNRPSQPTAQP